MNRKYYLSFLTIMFLGMMLCISFVNKANADYHSGTRTFNGVRYDSSVINTTFISNGTTYNYRGVYDDARMQWHGKANRVSLTKYDHAWNDVYYVGTTSEPNLIGRVFPIDGYLNNVGMDANWTFVKVYIYNNTMNNKKMDRAQRFSNATHEIGHTVKMKHPSDKTVTSVMHQGIQSRGASTWDIQELNKKWK
ncbi:hypothetical protein ACWE42_05665 [Sutcliffiella cohnii]